METDGETDCEREKHLDKIKESAEMGRAPKKTQSKHFNWKSIAKDENSESVLTKYFRDLYSISEEQEVNPIRETTLGGAVEKHDKRLCWWNVDLAKEIGKCLEETEKRERLTGSNHSRCLESTASRMLGKAGEVAVVVMAPKVVGATCLTKFRPVAGLCAMRKVLGYVWLKSLPPLRYESVQTALVPKTHADAGLFLLFESGGTVSRVAERNCGGTAGREESVRPCGPGNEIARCEFVLDGLDCGNLEWKLHEGMLGNGDVK